uniref:Uncharacterized protein n=1 Tax=Globodera rostochiensis TaxID=31243 RepID=A0A914H4E5_GLORO
MPLGDTSSPSIFGHADDEFFALGAPPLRHCPPPKNVSPGGIWRRKAPTDGERSVEDKVGTDLQNSVKSKHARKSVDEIPRCGHNQFVHHRGDGSPPSVLFHPLKFQLIRPFDEPPPPGGIFIAFRPIDYRNPPTFRHPTNRTKHFCARTKR